MLRTDFVLLMAGLLTLVVGCAAPVGPTATQIAPLPAQATATPSPAQGTWTGGAPMRTARSEIKAAAVDGRIYVAGGSDAGGGPLDAFEVYDPASDTWQAAASLPVALHHMVVAAAGGQVYVTGGYDSPGFTPDVSGGWVYDPATDRGLRRGAELVVLWARRPRSVAGVGFQLRPGYVLSR